MKNKIIIIALVALLSTSTILVACVVGYKVFQFLQDNEIEMSMDSETEPAKEDIVETVETVEAETDAVNNEADSTLVENSTDEISNETVEVETETTENETSEAETEAEFEEAPLSEGETAVELENEYVDGFSDGVMIIEKEDGTIDIIPDTVTPVRKMMESMTEEEFEAYMEEVYKRIDEENRRMKEVVDEARRRKKEGLPNLHLDMD